MTSYSWRCLDCGEKSIRDCTDGSRPTLPCGDCGSHNGRVRKLSPKYASRMAYLVFRGKVPRLKVKKKSRPIPTVSRQSV